eukprot:1945697-Pyramimonas_sp.AAC.1
MDGNVTHMSHHLARGERQCYTNVTPYGKRRAAVLQKYHTIWSEESGSVTQMSHHMVRGERQCYTNSHHTVRGERQCYTDVSPPEVKC